MRPPPYSAITDEILTQDSIENPIPLFKRLCENNPLSQIGDAGVYIAANWDLIDEILRRETDFSANLTGVLYRGESGKPQCFDLPRTAATQVIATADEPHHSVHRALIQARFISARIAQMEDLFRLWCKNAIEEWRSFDKGGRAVSRDVIPTIEKLPAMMVAHLLGLPMEDVDRFRVWAMMGGDMLAGEVTQQGLEFLATETANMWSYLEGQLDKAIARINTNDSVNVKALDEPVLLTLARGITGNEITKEEAIGIATVLFGAGGESTAALMGSTLKYLACDREMCQRLQAKPDLVPRFVEEITRLETPFKFHYRSIRQDCELAGYELRKGERMMLLWSAANRDRTRFEKPDQLILDRKHARQHMSYGRGAHFCIGAQLARLEARVFIEEMLAAFSSIELGSAPPVYAKSIFVRRLEQLPLVLA